MNEDITAAGGNLAEGLGEEGDEDAQEVQKLEREIEEVLRNRISTAEGLRHKSGADAYLNHSAAAHTIINISKGGGNAEHSLKMSGGEPRQQSAGTVMGGGGKRNLMSAAYRHRQNVAQAAGQDETNEFPDDIYEDEESSGDEMN